MKILLTGGTGFLGSHLLRRLLSEGHKIALLKRSFSDTRRIKDLLNDIEYYDIDADETEKAFFKNNNIDTIIHTAVSYGKNETVSSMLKTNLLFSLELMEYAKKYNVKSFFYANSKLDRYTSNYSLSKHQFAEWGKYLSSDGETMFADIKLEHMYGLDDDQYKFIPWLIKKISEQAPYVDLTLGEQKRDFIHIDDVTSAFLTILNNNFLQGYHSFEVGTGEVITIRSLAETIKSILKTTTKLNFGAIPYRKNETMNSKANTTVLKKLGWEPKIKLRDGLIQLSEFYRHNNLAEKT